MTATEILRIAADMDTATVNKMAHALGWQTSHVLVGSGTSGDAKMARPYRNYYSCSADDTQWTRAQALGLAKNVSEPQSDPSDAVWTVTRLGQAVVRLHLQAIVLARKANL